MEKVAIQGEIRSNLSKSATRQLRREGKVPCIIYGGNDNVTFYADSLSFRDIVYTADFKLAEITVDGKTHTCILKDLQMHPVKDTIEHIDFLRLIEGTPIKVDIPVRCVGASPGVKLGGKLQQKIRRVKVKTLPKDIKDHLQVDISSLELGQSVRVRDIEVGEDMQIMNPAAAPVATVDIPRALRSAAAKEEAKG